MKRAWLGVLLVTWIVATGTVGSGLCATAQPPPEGGVMPNVTLPVPQDAGEASYLGVEGKKSFKIPEIKADMVIVEIFSMYCPYCQKEAPILNKLYEDIAKDEAVRNKVKLIGIGAGNTPFEVKTFKEKYQVPFPLFADADFSLHQVFGDVRTPYFMVIKTNRDGSHKVIYSEAGSIGDPQDFLKLLLKKAGMKQGG